MNLTQEQKQCLFDALNEYSWREFEQQMFKSVDEIPNVIGLACTDVGDDDQYEIQCDFNIEELQWEEYINGELMRTVKHEIIEDFIKEIKYCTFDEIISDIYAMALEMEEGE